MSNEAPGNPASNNNIPSPITTHPFSLTIRDAWDKLGLVVGVSLTWALVMASAFSLERLVPRSVPLLFHLLLLGALVTCLLPLLMAGSFYVAHLVAIRDEVTYADFWRGGTRFYTQCLALTLCHFVIEGVLGVNAWFYGRMGHVGGLAIMLLCLYLLLFWSMMAAYHFPLLIAQEMGVFDEPDKPAKRGLFAIARRAFYLTLGRPFYALALLAVCGLIAVVFSATGVLFVLVGPGLLALLTTNAVRALLVQFGILSPPPTAETVVPDEKFRLR